MADGVLGFILGVGINLGYAFLATADDDRSNI